MNDSRKPGLDVPLEEIQMPPEDLTADLDNTAAPSALEPAPEVPVDIADLDFQSDPATRLAEVPLSHPFKWSGRTVKSITVRRLTVAKVGQIASKMRDGKLDLYEIYAAQTGLPAAVLRGLMDDDGDAVSERCLDFFPRVFRADDA
ncbi:phage tail assembly protein [Labrenzia sp. OB1]|uniref:phage tail assembly protein n=1 Tax=Labrenzia sp. OB1 TaxID=1561204 RepID=UPI0007B1EAA3|nr:phage tail assembly protein [Labrenzia sp. OB1]KZM49444.1 hypothetical protein OA90_15320 [Labrenzia sp. OB1]